MRCERSEPRNRGPQPPRSGGRAPRVLVSRRAVARPHLNRRWWAPLVEVRAKRAWKPTAAGLVLTRAGTSRPVSRRAVARPRLNQRWWAPLVEVRAKRASKPTAAGLVLTRAGTSRPGFEAGCSPPAPQPAVVGPAG